MSKKKLMALLLTGVMAASTVSVPVFAEEAEGGSSDTPLVIGQTNFSEKFSGLFHEAVPDQSVIFCGQFNTCPSVPLPTPAFALV